MLWTTAVLSFAMVAAGEPSADDVKKGLVPFQGTWRVVSMEIDGKPLAEEQRRKTKVAIHGEDFRFHIGEDTHAGLYKIDPTKDPKQLNIEITEGDEKGKVYLVIYKFEDGRMIQCMRLDNKSRPSTFSGSAGSGCMLEVWEKQKP
jgi:uncharacterized protein (TIGR03067 family)